MLDNSQMQTFKDCEERYRLTYLEALSKREEGVTEHHRNFGKAIHAGLETYYKGGQAQDAIRAFRQAYPENLDPEDKAKTVENGQTILAEYIKHYAAQDAGWEVLDVEKPYVGSIFGREFLVKKDMVVKQQGCIYAVEHKTTGKAFNWDYWNQFEPNSQISAQVWSTIQQYGECSGVIVNSLRFGHRQRVYKGEPAGFYWEFQRQVFNRNQEQVKAWLEDITSWTARLEETRLAPLGQVWLKNEGQCRYCSFKEVCISCNDEQIKEQLYERYDPLAYQL